MRITRDVSALSDTITGLDPEIRETLSAIRVAAESIERRTDKDAAETMRIIRDSARSVKFVATTITVAVIAFVIIDMIRGNR